MFLKSSTMEIAICFLKEECKVSYVKIVIWLILFKKGTNTLSFYIFDYDA